MGVFVFMPAGRVKGLKFDISVKGYAVRPPSKRRPGGRGKDRKKKTATEDQILAKKKKNRPAVLFAQKFRQIPTEGAGEVPIKKRGPAPGRALVYKKKGKNSVKKTEKNSKKEKRYCKVQTNQG